MLREQIIQGLTEDLEDPEYQAEIVAWDTVIGDGLEAQEREE